MAKLGSEFWTKQKNEIFFTVNNIINPTDIKNLQELSPVMDWLQKNTEKDSSVYSIGENLSWAIPIYTSNNVYFNANAGLCGIMSAFTK